MNPELKKLLTASAGDSWDETGNTPVSGIHLHGHCNAIEIYSESYEGAVALRDEVLKAIAFYTEHKKWAHKFKQAKSTGAR